MTAAANHNGTLNVLMVNASQTSGGAGRVGGTLAAGLRRTGHAVQAFVASNGTGDPSCHVVRHWRLATATRWLRAHGLPELGEVGSLLWSCHSAFATSDVLHLHNLHGDYLSLMSLPLWGRSKPIVWTLHDFWPLTGNCAAPRTCTRWRASCGRCPATGVYPMASTDRSRFFRRLKPWLISQARPQLIAPSRWLAEQVRAVPALGRLSIRVIPNPIDTELFVPATDRAALRAQLGLATDAPLVVMAGMNWSDPAKGGADAVTALRAAARRIPRLQLLVIGTESDELLARSGLSGRALPAQCEQHALAVAYACADVCLFPSRAENYPLTPLEAMACGTPVVAYAVGGLPEQIGTGQTGFLAQAGQPLELTRGLLSCAQDAAHARALGAAGRSFVQRTCSLTAVTTQYVDEYARAIRSWSGRRDARPRRSRGIFAIRVSRALGWEPGTPAALRRELP